MKNVHHKPNIAAEARLDYVSKDSSFCIILFSHTKSDWTDVEKKIKFLLSSTSCMHKYTIHSCSTYEARLNLTEKLHKKYIFSLRSLLLLYTFSSSTYA